MKDQEETWLRDLAQQTKDDWEEEGARVEERWVRLSRGEFSPEEEAELQALAATSEDARAAYELFRPFSSEEKGRMLDALKRQDREEKGRLLHFVRRHAVVVAGALSTAAAAAAVVLAFIIPPPGPIPLYVIAELTGFEMSNRGGATGTPGIPVFGSGNALSLHLNPPHALKKVDADCYFVRPNEAQPCADGVLEVGPKGSVEVRGIVGDQIRLSPGDWQLCVIVGYRFRLPKDSVATCLQPSSGAPAGAGYQVIRKPFKVETPVG